MKISSLCLPGVVPDIGVGKKGGEGCGPGSGCALAWRGFGNQRTSSRFVTGREGPRTVRWLPDWLSGDLVYKQRFGPQLCYYIACVANSLDP